MTKLYTWFSPYKIIDKSKSCADSYTFTFADDHYPVPEPGQFYMVWLPGISENPISASGKRSITIRDLGPSNNDKFRMTHEIMKLEPGDNLMMRGPYGTGFEMTKYCGQKICLIGGGCGTAPLRYLGKKFAADSESLNYSISGIIGAKSRENLLFANEFVDYSRGNRDPNMIICTDDGTEGEQGTVIDMIDRLGVDDQTHIFICGPEVMMARAAEMLVEKGARPGYIQVLIERYMKCAVGVCGSCDCDGERICKTPVLTIADLDGNADFGIRERRPDGTYRLFAES